MTTRKDKRRAFKNRNQKNEKGDGVPCAKKSLGQNFLGDELFLAMIVKAADLKKEDNILEIGPGTGLLTDQLIKVPQKIICIEKDQRMVEYLNTKYGTNDKECQNKKIQIIEADITEVNLPKFLKENDFCDYKVVANIPYYITGKIFRLLLETEIQPKQIVLLIQKEVAQRVSSKPGAMNILAVAVQYYADVELLAVVPRTAFEPAPKVDSAIISVKPFLNKKRETKEKEKEFFKLIKSGFSSPRKKLLSNIAVGLKKDKSELLAIFEKFNWNQSIRAQNLAVEEWKKLRDKIFGKQ